MRPDHLPSAEERRWCVPGGQLGNASPKALRAFLCHFIGNVIFELVSFTAHSILASTLTCNPSRQPAIGGVSAFSHSGSLIVGVHHASAVNRRGSSPPTPIDNHRYISADAVSHCPRVFSGANFLDPFRRGSEPFRCVVDAERSWQTSVSCVSRFHLRRKTQTANLRRCCRELGRTRSH